MTVSNNQIWRAGWRLALVLALPAVQSVTASAQTATSAKACLGRDDVIGLSRIVEIDTGNGPRFGEQYEENVFLEPGEVVLTFDDGPLRRLTTPILETLDKHCVKATFFAVGRMAAADPAMLREIDRRGHTIGSHTWSHKKLGRVGLGSAKYEVELGMSAVAAALGKPVAPFFRFPYLSDPKSVQEFLRNRRHGIFGIDVDSRDFNTRSGNVMRDRVLAGLKKKGRGIILFHDIQRSTQRGLDSLLTALKAKGYKVVHMVAKENAKTLAKYDAIAVKRIKRSADLRAKRPLADRAVTWPNASGTGAANTEVLPWQKSQNRDASTNTVSRAPKSRPRTDDGPDRWQIHPFGR